MFRFCNHMRITCFMTFHFEAWVYTYFVFYRERFYFYSFQQFGPFTFQGSLEVQYSREHFCNAGFNWSAAEYRIVT